MSTTLPDAEARRLALDPQRSLCVVAPAGSGKTELLIRRYLTLLARVQEPEEILAFTFTRKAAAEMRERVLLHLRAAAASDAGEHDETLALAHAALVRDRERGWQLLSDPARLKVQTIDAFCAWLSSQLPVLSTLGGAMPISEDEAGCRHEAARRLLGELERGGELGSALEILLAREDNNTESVLNLCSEMLARRDHWLPLITYFDVGIDAAEHGLHARTALEAGRRQLWREQAAAARALLGDVKLDTVASLLATAACNLRHSANSSPAAVTLIALARQDTPEQLTVECRQLLHTEQPTVAEEQRAAAVWAAVAALLLSSAGTWRKKIDRRTGFPADSTADADKKELMILLEVLSQHGADSAPLRALSQLPAGGLNDAEWRALSAVQLLLWHSAARLELVFGERGEIDYSSQAMAATRALGAADTAPSELAIALGCRLKHILVDEFQDISHSQFHLIERLVAGWAEYNEADPQAPCTLFTVGDSMQSCYAFRNADPQLFLRLQERGINDLSLQTVTLSANFRSRPQLVDWVNNNFGPLFGSRQDLARGVVPYHSATAILDGGDASSEVRCELLPYGEEQQLKTQTEAERAEAARVLHWIAQARAERPKGRIAVLVRNRSHLRALLPAMARAGLSWSAEAMDLLSTRPAVLDLASLSAALADPADRLAWLALLRAPWCGLGHAALQWLATGAPQSLWQRCLAAVERDGGALATAERERLARFVAALSPAMARRGRVTHTDLVYSAWLALSGPACFLPDVDQLEDVETLFTLLREWDGTPSATQLAQRLQQLYAAPAGDDSLQLMTIHNAKGLEFDTVILCGLHRGHRHDSAPLIRWESRHFDDAEASEALLFALRPPVACTEDGLYRFLTDEARARSQLEEQRLLYVAATRAIRRLHLSACTKVKRDEAQGGARGGSALHLLWQLPALRAAFVPVAPATTGAEKLAIMPATIGLSAPGHPPGQRRLHASWQRPPLARAGPQLFSGARSDAPPTTVETRFGSDNWAARRIGTVMHDALEQISLEGAARWHGDETRLQAAERVWAAELREAGLATEVLRAGLAKLRRGVRGALADERGRWLLDPAREQAESELSLLYFDEGGALRQARVDRSFVADGERWIIDYKSSEPRAGQSLADFLQSEEDSYRAQLGLYAVALRALDPGRVLRCALYFPLLAQLHELALDRAGVQVAD